jgi:hypothetical protein
MNFFAMTQFPPCWLDSSKQYGPLWTDCAGEVYRNWAYKNVIAVTKMTKSLIVATIAEPAFCALRGRPAPSQLHRSDRGRLPFALTAEKATLCDVHHIVGAKAALGCDRDDPGARR